MDIQVNKDQLYRVAIKWLKQHYGNLTPKEYNNFSNKVFYLNSDHELVMEHNQKNGFIFISYKHIWSKVESIFHLNGNDDRPILNVCLRENYDIVDATTEVDEFF